MKTHLKQDFKSNHKIYKEWKEDYGWKNKEKMAGSLFELELTNNTSTKTNKKGSSAT